MKQINIAQDRIMYFDKYEVKIDAKRVAIDTESNVYQEYLTALTEEQEKCGVYGGEYEGTDWILLNSLTFDVAITFEYDGEFKRVASQVKKLLSSGPILNLTSLLENEKFADFTFKIRGQELKVHKNLLSAASEALDAMFTCGLDETKNNSATVDCNPEVFKHFLKFIYANTIPYDEMPTICIELHELAHRYRIDKLQKICLLFIDAKKINANNALELYEFAATYEVAGLLQSSWEFISK